MYQEHRRDSRVLCIKANLPKVYCLEVNKPSRRVFEQPSDVGCENLVFGGM